MARKLLCGTFFMNIKKKILQKTGRALQFARPVSLYCVTVKIPPAMQGEGRSLDISNLLC